MNLKSGRLEHALYEILFWILLFGFAIASIGLWLSGHIRLSVVSSVPFVLLVYGGFIEPQFITVKTFHLPLVKKPERWLKTVFLSDLHAGSWKGKGFYDRLVARVNQLKPDLLLIGGDLVEERANPIKDLASFAHLAAKEGKYFILGNHDFLDDPRAVREQLVTWGFEDVTNRSRLVRSDGRAFELVGLDDSWFGSPDVSLLRAEKKHPRFVLTHEPDILSDFEEGDADAIVMGHTHGGQVRLPLIGSLTRLPQYAPQWLDRGLRHWKKIPVIISQGLGEANARIRFFCPPQIVVIEVGI